MKRITLLACSILVGTTPVLCGILDSFVPYEYERFRSRWWQRDPAADVYPSHTPYGYSGNNPVRFLDPNGRWYIEAVFSADRSQTGTVTLYDSAGNVHGQWEALAKGTGGDWSNDKGSTPTGRYSINGTRSDGESPPWLSGSDSNRMGPNPRLKFGDAISGDAVEAQTKYGRTVDEFRIHGDNVEGEFPEGDALAPTWGCVRMFNADMKALYDAVTEIEAANGDELPQHIDVDEQ